MESIIITPIGKVHSFYKEPVNVPIQPKYAKGSKAHIEIFDEFIDGIKDIDLFSHIIVLFHLHLATGEFKLKVIPFMDNVERGVFATRAPRRPNHIGLSVVKIERVEKNIIYIDHCDIEDQSPVIDIKPYNPEFDIFPEATSGWYDIEKVKNKRKKSDQRFS